MWSLTPSLQKLTKENQKPQFGPPLIQNREQQILYSGHHPSLVHLQERPAAGKGRSFSLPSFEMDRETGTSDATCCSTEDGGDSKEAAIAKRSFLQRTGRNGMRRGSIGVGSISKRLLVWLFRSRPKSPARPE